MVDLKQSLRVPIPTRTVIIGDMAVSDNPADVIVTSNLGSCLGVTVYDPESGVGGILHAVLPENQLASGEPAENPWRFVDMGLPLFLAAAHHLGARREHSVIRLFGCAQVSENLSGFAVGARNLATAKGWLEGKRIPYQAVAVGGSTGRSVFLEIASGQVWVKESGKPPVALKGGRVQPMMRVTVPGASIRKQERA